MVWTIPREPRRDLSSLWVYEHGIGYIYILANLPDVTLAPLVRVQHSAARLIRNLTKRDSVLPVMMELHWAATSFQNNTQIVCVDARRPLRLGTKIPGRDGRSHLVPTRSRASSFIRFTELWHLPYQTQIYWTLVCGFRPNSMELSSFRTETDE